MYPAERGAGGYKLATGLNNAAFYALTALADAVITVNVIPPTNSPTQYASLPLPAGVTIYGNFTACNVVSGTVWGYPGGG